LFPAVLTSFSSLGRQARTPVIDPSDFVLGIEATAGGESVLGAKRRELVRREAETRKRRRVAPRARTMTLIRSFTSLVDQTVPPWLQVVVFGYLSVVLMTSTVDKFRERRSLLLAVAYLAVAVLFGLRATFVLIDLLNVG
jgi:hypothetical protein